MLAHIGGRNDGDIAHTAGEGVLRLLNRAPAGFVMRIIVVCDLDDDKRQQRIAEIAPPDLNQRAKLLCINCGFCGRGIALP